MFLYINAAKYKICIKRNIFKQEVEVIYVPKVNPRILDIRFVPDGAGKGREGLSFHWKI